MATIRKGKRVKKIKVTVSSLDKDQREIYDFWIKYFGEIISIFAATRYIWPPGHPKQIKDTTKNLGELYEKRLWRLARLLDEGYSREEAIRKLDRGIRKSIRIARGWGKTVEDNSIWYELAT